jgi:hypothetical protein
MMVLALITTAAQGKISNVEVAKGGMVLSPCFNGEGLN